MTAIYDAVLDENQPPVVVAEAGINHNGHIGSARELVEAAAESGADVIKFQTHLPAHEMVPNISTASYVGEPLFDLLTRMVLSREEHVELMDLARRLGIEFMSTPFSREAADLLDEIGVSVFKVGSGEATNLPLLAHIATKHKPMLISTGMTSLNEIEEAVGCVRALNPQIALLHCTSMYPTPYRDVRLRGIGLLRDRFPGTPIGLSDHSTGVYTAIGAVALGARILEKHFTISRSWEGPDQQVSIGPHELAELVRGARAMHAAMQSDGTDVLPDEVPVQQMARESVVTVAEVRAGEAFSEGNTWVKRPGTGIAAKEYPRVVGRTAKRDLPRDTTLHWEDIDDP